MIHETLKEKVADSISDYVTKVVINHETEIDTFAVKKGIGNRAKVSFFVPSLISTVEHISIFSDEDVLADSVVDVPMNPEYDNLFSWQIEVNDG